MMNLSSLLGLAGLGGDLLKVRMTRRLMKDISGVIVLAIATGFMAGALLVGLFWLAYQGLVQSGLEPFAAMVYLLVMCGLVMYALLRITTRRVRQLKLATRSAMPGSGAFNARMYSIVDGFIDGLLQPRR